MTNLPEKITRLRLADENGFSYSDYMHHFPRALQAIEQLIALMGVAHEALGVIKQIGSGDVYFEAKKAISQIAPIAALAKGGE